MTYREVLEQHEAFLRDGKIPVQRCAECGARQWFPRRVCRVCLSREVEWEASKGLGTIHSFSVLHRTPDPERELPYAIALIDLDEGVRTMATMEDPADPNLACEARVRLERVEVRDGQEVAVFSVVEP